MFVWEELTEFGFVREECEKNFENHCSSPLHKHEGPQWKTSGDGSAQTRRHGGSYPQIVFVPPKFCGAQKNLFQTYDKN